MTSIEPIKTNAVSALTEGPRQQFAKALPSEDQSAAPRTEAAQAQITARDAGTAPPVDTERVSAIKRAVETGTYPILPAKIADAMIAAGYLLQQKA